jgi:hypothetical protein
MAAVTNEQKNSCVLFTEVQTRAVSNISKSPGACISETTATLIPSNEKVINNKVV